MVFLTGLLLKVLSVRLYSKSHQKSSKCQNLLTGCHLGFLGGNSYKSTLYVARFFFSTVFLGQRIVKLGLIFLVKPLPYVLKREWENQLITWAIRYLSFVNVTDVSRVPPWCMVDYFDLMGYFMSFNYSFISLHTERHLTFSPWHTLCILPRCPFTSIHTFHAYTFLPYIWPYIQSNWCIGNIYMPPLNLVKYGGDL